MLKIVKRKQMRKIISLLRSSKNRKLSDIMGALLYYTKEDLNKLREDALKNSENFILYNGQKVFFYSSFFEFFTHKEMQLLFEKSIANSCNEKGIIYLLYLHVQIGKNYYIFEIDCSGNYMVFFFSYLYKYHIIIRAISKKYFIDLIKNSEKEEVKYIELDI